MADTVGQSELRGIDIDKLAKGFADEEFIFKNYLNATPTSAREIRWYRKTAGTLDSTDTTGITASQLEGVGQLALPDVIEQSATRQTSYVKKFFVESPWLAWEDIRDCDLDMLAINVRDLTRGIANRVDKRIYNTLSGGLALSGSSMGTGWDDTTNGNPILDLLSGAMAIRSQSYDVSNLVVLMSPTAYKWLVNYVITVKGSSIPAFASSTAQSGVLTSVIGQRIVVSNNATDNWVVQIVPNRIATWKTFQPITAITKDEPGIGVKIRVWEEGEILLTDPNAGFVINAQL